MITEDFVVDFVNRTKKISEKINPSFFELTVAMAFEYFAQQKVDIAIIETGLGGRLDSTNIIQPILSIITNIGYDHMNILGNTLQEIAFEKAGIIKPNTPVIIGEYLPETKNIFIQKSIECNAPIYFAQDKYITHTVYNNLTTLKIQITKQGNNKSSSFSLDLNGLYQTKNIGTVISALDILQEKKFYVSEDDKINALANVKKLTGFYGRWDVVQENPMVVLDVAHNEDGMKQVILQIKNLSTQINNVHIVIGLVKDKVVSKVLSLLPKDAQYYFTNAHIPRAMLAGELLEIAAEYSLQGNCFDDVNEAILAAKKNTTHKDLIIVCGSVFLVGEVNY